MTKHRAPITDDQLRIVPANEASWDDLIAVFGTADYSGRCHCQRLKVRGWIWRDSTQEQRTAMLRTQTAAGHPIALPVVVRRGLPLLFRAWRPGQTLVAGSFGVPRPDKDQPERTPRVLIVPLLAFDRAGYRLGYGGGFYDRTLAGLWAQGEALAIGVGFAVQEVPRVPRDGMDARLDWVVTEREALQI